MTQINTKLTDDQVVAFRERLSGGEHLDDLAEEHGVSHKYAMELSRGRARMNVGGPMASLRRPLAPNPICRARCVVCGERRMGQRVQGVHTCDGCLNDEPSAEYLRLERERIMTGNACALGSCEDMMGSVERSEMVATNKLITEAMARKGIRYDGFYSLSRRWQSRTGTEGER